MQALQDPGSAAGRQSARPAGLGAERGFTGRAASQKGMHWATFWRLHASDNISTVQAFAGMSAKLNTTMKRLEKINNHPG